MGKTKIEWTDITWNPVTGCDPISDGCDHCYAAKMAKRLKGMGQYKYRNGFRVTEHIYCINEPFYWDKPRMVFVCSMSDIFNVNISMNFLKVMFMTMKNSERHIFQLLTKRVNTMATYYEAKVITFSPNMWVGITVEHLKYYDRIKTFQKINAAVKFLSLEPLLSDMPNLDLTDIDWVIVGGESGHGSREIKEEWVIDIKNQCKSAGIPFFFKGWGGINKKKSGNLLQGEIYQEMPKSIKN